MTEVKCEKCDSTDGNIHRHPDGEISGFSCKKCGHHTVFYHITEKGRKIIGLLLEPIQNCSDTPTEEKEP